MNYLELKVQQISRKNNKTSGRLEHLTITASNGKETVVMDCPVHFIGTYKNDNVIIVSEKISVDTVFDLVEGEQGWGINLNPKVKMYYSKYTLFMPDEFGVKVKKVV